MPVQLGSPFSIKTHANITEMRPEKRLGSPYVVMCSSADTPPFHLRAWQPRRDEGAKQLRSLQQQKKWGRGRGGHLKRKIVLWETAFQTTGLSWEISVKRVRELFPCFPLFRDISCGILLFRHQLSAMLKVPVSRNSGRFLWRHSMYSFYERCSSISGGLRFQREPLTRLSAKVKTKDMLNYI